MRSKGCFRARRLAHHRHWQRYICQSVSGRVSAEPPWAWGIQAPARHPSPMRWCRYWLEATPVRASENGQLSRRRSTRPATASPSGELTTERDMEADLLYQSGMSMTQVSNITGIPVSTLQYRFKKAGISRARSEAVKMARRPSGPAHNRLDLSGRRFGNLLVIRSAGTRSVGKNNDQKSIWVCVCDCGNERIIFGSSLSGGKSRSCGCVERDRRRKHKVSDTRTYRIWQAMLGRCRYEKHSLWHRYGGRGITVCVRWQSYENFLSDMGEAPEGMSIERNNNDGNYCPENCRWATRKEQARNTSRNRWIEFNGKRQILKDWAKDLGIDQSSLRQRLDKLPLPDALTTPKAR